MNTKWLMSLGSTLAATKFANTISRIEADGVLRYAGLAKRRSHLFDNLTLLGMGALAGAGAALLLAPARGQEFRERLAFRLAKTKDATADALRDAKDRAPALLEQARAAVRHESTPQTR